MSVVIDLKELKRVLKYDPKTGLWTNRVTRGGNGKVGKVTGRPNSDGYIQICYKGKRYMSSRLAYFYMTGRWPPFEMDHKDLNHKNDRWKNLRPATDSQNQMNRTLQRNNRSRCRGVFKRENGRWSAYIGKNKKRKWLGTFALKKDAVAIRQSFERKMFVDFMVVT
jgi:hypothetical protein